MPESGARSVAVTVALLATRPRGWSVMVATEAIARITGRSDWICTARRPLLPCSRRSRPAGRQLNRIILIIGVDLTPHLTRSTVALKLNQC